MEVQLIPYKDDYIEELVEIVTKEYMVKFNFT